MIMQKTLREIRGVFLLMVFCAIGLVVSDQ